MYELKIYNKRDGLVATFVDDSKEVKAVLNEKQVYEIMDEVKQSRLNIGRINFSGNNLSLKCGSIKVTLISHKRFRNNKRFSFIFNELKKRRYKLMARRSILPGALLATLLFVIPSPVNSTSYVNEDFNGEMTNESNVVQDEEPVYFEPFIGDDVSLNQTKNNHPFSNKNLESLDYGSLVGKEKYNKTRELYGPIIERYADMYGINPDVILAIATQERGVHASEVDAGGAVGLMQIQVSVWDNSSVKAYNYETNEEEKIDISLEKLRDISFNVKVGCAIFQNYLAMMKDNVLAAIQCYNMGPGTMQKIIGTYAKEVGKTTDEVLESNDDGWLDYRNDSYAGDVNYVEHVLRYLDTGAKKI